MKRLFYFLYPCSFYFSFTSNDNKNCSENLNFIPFERILCEAIIEGVFPPEISLVVSFRPTPSLYNSYVLSKKKFQIN